MSKKTKYVQEGRFFKNKKKVFFSCSYTQQYNTIEPVKIIYVDTQLLTWKDANDTGKRKHYRIIVMCFILNLFQKTNTIS